MTEVSASRFSPDRRWLFALAMLYGLAVLVYLLLVGRVPLPVVQPDEYTYGHLARSIADGDGLTWRGQHVAMRAALYVYAITPAWVGHSTTRAYALTKAEGTLLVCLTVFPMWVLARRFLTPGLALLCAVLIVAGTWMTTAGSLLTENLAFPLATAALAALVIAVMQPGGRAGWVALGLTALASWARLQSVALVPVLLGALVVAAIAGVEPARRRLRRDRTIVIVTAVLSVAGTVAVLAKPSILGSYTGLAHFRPSISDLFAAFGHQSVGLVAMAGIVPVLIVLAGSTRRGAWRDPAAGAPLAVTWAAAMVFLVESAWSMTGFGNWHIQRYVEYVLPVLFLTAVVLVQRDLVSRRRLAGATVVVAGLLLFAPPIRQVLEERAAWAISLRMDDLLGVGTPVALALATAILGGLAVLLVHVGRDRDSSARAAIVVCALTLIVFAVQDEAGWRWETQLARASRVGYPADLQWIDNAGDGPVARLIAVASPWRWKSTEFFNRDITQVYGSPDVAVSTVRGTLCRWSPSDSGEIQFSGPCGSVPRRFYTDDDYARVRLYDQHTEAVSPVVGRVVSVPGRPRLESVLYVPCSPTTPAVDYGNRGRIAAGVSRCVPAMQAELWLDAPGTLVLTFRGDGVDHIVTAGSRSYTLAPSRVTRIRVSVAKGASVTPIRLDWEGPTPRLTGAALVQGATTTDLLG